MITLIGAGKLARKFYREYRNNYDINVVGTNWEQFQKFEYLFTTNAFLLENFGLQKALQTLNTTVICMVAPSRDRLIEAAKQNIPLVEVYTEVYVDFAQELTELLLECTHVEHLVWCSSVGIYGNHGGKVVDEQSPILVKEGTSKRCLYEAECYIKGLVYQGVNTTILRFGKLYAQDRSVREMYDIAKSCLNEQTKNHRINLTHELDAVLAIYHCVANRIFGTFNVTNDLNQIPYYQLIYKIAKHFDLPTLPVDSEGSMVLPTNCVASSERIKETGFKFQYLDNIE